MNLKALKEMLVMSTVDQKAKANKELENYMKNEARKAEFEAKEAESESKKSQQENMKSSEN